MLQRGCSDDFFENCKFLTAGVHVGKVDGNTLLPLWEDSDAEAIFIAPVPNSLGFNKIIFCERLKSEMACRLAYNTSLSLRFLSGKQGLPIARRTDWGLA